jgi:Tol biopolymer transport system component
MTDQDLERRLRAWYRADGDDADSAPPQLRADLAGIGQEAEPRRVPSGWRFPRVPRSAPLAIGATALIAAILIGLALFLGQPPNVGPTGSPSPTSSASAEPSTTPSPGLPLGGGLILMYQPHVPPGPCSNISDSPFDVYTVDAGTGDRTLLGTARSGCGPRGIAFQWAPDRIHILMTGQPGMEVLTLDPMTAAGQQLSFICCDLPRLPDFWQDGWVLSPSGDRVAAIHALEAGFADGVEVANIDGSGATTLLLPAGATMTGDGLSWSPDQSGIVVGACLPCDQAEPGQPPTTVQKMHLFVVPVDGSAVRDVVGITSGAFDDWRAAWSPDASTFAAIRSECQSEITPVCHPGHPISVLELVDAADGSEQVLARPDGQVTAPKWSPTGARIAFRTSTDESGGHVFVIDADGGNLVSLGAGTLLGWSPDGDWLLVARVAQDGSVSDNWVVRADGTDERHVGSFLGAAW